MNKFLLQKDGKSDSSETQKITGTRGSDVCVSIKIRRIFDRGVFKELLLNTSQCQCPI